MDLYSLALFLHIGGALVLVALLAIEGVSLRVGFDSAPLNRVLGPISAVLILLPGVYMVVTQTGWTAWAVVGLVSWVAIAIAGAATGVSVMRGRIDRRLASVSWTVRVGVSTGVVFVMTVKPGLLGSLAAVLLGAALGAVAGTAAQSRVQRA